MAQFNEADLKKLSKDEVIEEAERLGIDSQGTKAAIITRLLEFDERDTDGNGSDEDDDDALEPDTDELEDDEELDDEEPVAAEADDEEDDDDEVEGPADDTEAEAVKEQRKRDAADIKAVASRPEPEDEEDDLELDEEEIDEPEPPKAKRSRAKSDTPKAVKAAKQAEREESDGTGTIPAKQVASMLGVEAKTLRQFFRSPASTVEAVGAGGRYEFAESDVDQIKAEFEKWRSEHAARGTKRGEGSTRKRGAAKPKPEVTEVEDAEELDIDELDDEIDEGELELEDED